ncbi:hypothetical protein TEA_014808 [Camellia sinensis var. sinensis]|uniref:Protein kinase domain-containing protein n=1 Tax=Camellia sinensis var. sinensis TaxID=542762 RepID=A0A4S4EJI5_CAMSN|nr:hypothetical protein TEA_014808 [Camellia sinensis var. sinensis]
MMQLLREINHENVVKLVNGHINHVDMSLYLAFDYAEHDLYEIIRHHRDKVNQPINLYTVKSLLWQLLNGLNYLHSNWIIHRDLKPSNILVGFCHCCHCLKVMGEGEEQGVIKIADFGLARIYQAPLKSLSENGVVVTIWYRAPELLLGAKHYTSAVDMWAVGCIFAELLTLKPLFQGQEVKATPNPFQLDQLDKIFKVLGHPTQEKWPTLVNLPHWQSDMQHIQGHKYDNPGLYSVVHLSPKNPAYDLLSKMLEYDPRKRITAAQALDHEYFRLEPLPGRNALVPSQPGEKVVNYPTRPVDTTTDFEGTTSLQSSQPVSSGNAVSGSMAAHAVPNRAVPRPMPVVGMPRLQPQGMVAAYNLTAQAGMGGMNPGSIPMQRGVAAQVHQQQQSQQRGPQWPTIDGPLGLSEEASIGYARRFFKFGFFVMPFLWALNCLYFWPVLRHSRSFPQFRHYVVGSAVGFVVFTALLSSWALTFAIGGERLFGHVWNDLVMYNVAESPLLKYLAMIYDKLVGSSMGNA